MKDLLILAPLATGAVALFIFAVSRVWEVWRESVRRTAKADEDKRAIAQLRDAIHIEIRYNVDDLEQFLANPIDVEVIMAALQENPKRTLFLPYSRNLRVYEAVIGEIRVLPSRKMKAVIRFYNDLEGLYALQDAFERESFRYLTDAGKRQAITSLFSIAEDTLKAGRIALCAFDELDD